MSTRGVLRVVLVALAVSIAALVVWNWGGGPVDTTEEPTLDIDDAGELRFRSESLDYTHMVNGVPRYRISASTNLGYKDGRSEWIDDVRLALYPAPQEEGVIPEPTVITGGKLLVTQDDAGMLKDARFEEHVHVELAGGGTLDSSLLTYHHDDEVVSTEAGVEMRLVGLVARARSMVYDNAARYLWLREDLVLTGDPEESAGSAPVDLSGRARTLTYDADSSLLQLEGSPVVSMPEAVVGGDLLRLDIDREANRLRAVEAIGEGAVLWGDPSAEERTELSADLVTLDLDDEARLERIRLERRRPRRPRLESPSAGLLLAETLELVLEAGGGGRVEADQQVLWQGISGAATGIEGLRCESLVLRLGNEDLEAAAARGAVRLSLTVAEGGDAAELRGPSLELLWLGEELQRAAWAQGVTYTHGETSLQAATGDYEPESGRWTMRGDPRPVLTGAQYRVEAGEITLEPEGALRASGRVESVLRGDRVATIAPIFGGAEALNVASETLLLDGSGSLVFGGGSRIWESERYLRADDVILAEDPMRLEASGNVLVFLEPPRARSSAAEGEPGEAGGEAITLRGDLLLMEGSPPELRLAGDAELLDGERRIVGTPFVFSFDDEGEWRAVEVQGEVVMEDPAGTARGSSMVLDPGSGVVTILGSASTPATFTNDQGVDIRDPRGLRLSWTEQDLRITALQQGLTQTVRARREGG